MAIWTSRLLEQKCQLKSYSFCHLKNAHVWSSVAFAHCFGLESVQTQASPPLPHLHRSLAPASSCILAFSYCCIFIIPFLPLARGNTWGSLLIHTVTLWGRLGREIMTGRTSPSRLHHRLARSWTCVSPVLDEHTRQRKSSLYCSCRQSKDDIPREK